MSKMYSFRCDEQIVKTFQSRYFGLMSKYIVSALRFALQSENNFNMVFFDSEEKSKEVVYGNKTV